MAFKFFNKKEANFPAEEKAEILEGDEGFPELPEFPELPSFPDMPPAFQEDSNFEQGFRSPEELKPHLIRRPMQPQPRMPTELPPFERPEPMPMPRPEPRGLEAPMRFESDFGPLPRMKGAPHIYIRVNKYKEVMNAVESLKEQIGQTKNDLEEIHSISESEREKIRESATVLLEIEKLLSYLEKTFTSPED